MWSDSGSRGKGVAELFDRLTKERSDFDRWYYSLKDLVLPHAPGELEKTFEIDGVTFRNIYDSTAIYCCGKLAAAHQSNITPPYKQWFKFVPKALGQSTQWSNLPDVKKWYSKGSEVAFNEIAQSNFYAEMFSVYLDRCAFGTGCLYTGVTGTGAFHFECVPYGNFVGAENAEGIANLIIRVVSYTAAQALEFFGQKALSDKMQEALDDPATAHTKKFLILHMVRERQNRIWGERDKMNKPYESLYVEKESGHILEEGGFDEFPFCVTRFIKWGTSGKFYGVAPGRMCYPDIISCQKQKRIKAILAEIAAFPRIKQSADYEGQIDFRPGGVTTIDQTNANFPVEWATQGRAIYSKEELAESQRAIREAYMVDAIQLFLQEQKQMTATEANFRDDEKLMAFTPSFSLFIKEFEPTMIRIMNLLYRAGKLPPAPPAVKEYMYQFNDSFLPPPTVSYQSKYATKLRELQNSGMVSSCDFLGRLAGMGDKGVAALDNFDFDFAAVEIVRGQDAAEDFILPKSDVEMNRKKRMEAQMMAMQMQMQQEAAAQGSASAIPQQGQQSNDEGVNGYGVEL